MRRDSHLINKTKPSLHVKADTGRRVVLSLLFLLITFFCYPSSSFAEDSSYASGATLVDPSDQENLGRAMIDPQYEQCGQDCLYAKANENISLQADFVLKKIEYLTNPMIDSDDKKKVLGPFCRSSEEGDDCANRYIALHRYWFMKVRGALGKNETSQSSLGCTRDSEGNCIKDDKQPKAMAMGERLPGSNEPNPPKKLAQVTHLPTYDELQKQAKDEAWRKYSQQIDQLNGISSPSDKDWAEKTANAFKPSRDDFIRFKTVPKDSDHPELGTTEVPMTDALGNLVHDDVAYQRAMAAWEGKAGSDSLLKQLKDHQAEFEQQHTKSKQELTSQPGGGTPPSAGGGDNRGFDHYLYDQARGESVDAVNQAIQESGERRPAAKKKSDVGNLAGQKDKTQSKQKKLSEGGSYSGNERVKVPEAKPDQEGNTTGRFTYSYSPEAFSRDQQSQTSPPGTGGSSTTSATSGGSSGAGGSASSSSTSASPSHGTADNKSSVPGANVKGPDADTNTQTMVDQLFF